ncbi:FliH/SctL family protein [Paraburkholderia bonniea]|uniref:FliH/SctL family protein n=1 Tax=Paraburkholderia bonniea TaxID=2152891 RepID=UPI00257341F4|nr:FliH/SctL family protein [Paraburkholderia bonniea]WJF90774.1 FliH/SctL family protein [Paraburkholderia bonniea]WJF94088.1 FliH/SctL family protein [Paraburkholderia bonniea]
MKPAKSYRRYSFPQLARLRARSESQPLGPETLSPGLDAHISEDMLEESRQSGYHDGYQEGYEGGRNSALAAAQRSMKSALADLAKPLDDLIAGFRQVQQEYQASVRNEIAGLVEKATRQVIRSELTLRPEQLFAFVDEVLAEMPKPPETVEVRLNPDEYQRIHEALPERARHWHLTPDPRLVSGECRVTADQREMDAGCGQRLAACIEQISTYLSGAEAELETAQSRAVASGSTRAVPASLDSLGQQEGVISGAEVDELVKEQVERAVEKPVEGAVEGLGEKPLETKVETVAVTGTATATTTTDTVTEVPA